MKVVGASREFVLRPQLMVLLLMMLFMLAARSSSELPWFKLADLSSSYHPTKNVFVPKYINHFEAIVPQTADSSLAIDCKVDKCLALTFDDGPNPITTPQVLTELEQAHVKATFFVVGSRVAGNEALLRRMYTDGDQIGSHSWSHPDMTKLSVDMIKQQITLTQNAVISAGVPAPTVFRPPYGAVNQTVESNVPLSILLWNEDPRDWAANKPVQVVQAVEAAAHPGGIVDMHDIYHVTANALPQILTDLSAQGFHFVTVDQLLELNPSSRGIYYGIP